MDVILGQESHVRILRVLTEYEHPIPPVELAHQTRLDLSGVLRALDRLEDAGVTTSLGVGRGRVIRFNTEHYFASVLRAVFDAERARRQRLLDALQDAARSLDPPPRAVWIEGPHAWEADTVLDPLRIGVLVDVRDRHATTDRLGERLREIERRFDLTTELVPRTVADLGTATPEQLDELRRVLPVYGVPPWLVVDGDRAGSGSDAADLGDGRDGVDTVAVGGQTVGRHPPAPPNRRGPRTHAELDLTSRQTAARIAHLLKRDPRLVERARRWLEHRLSQASEAERHELREWGHILDMPAHRVRAFLLDPGERATRLRQTSPFVAVLTPHELTRLLHTGTAQVDALPRRRPGARGADR